MEVKRIDDPLILYDSHGKVTSGIKDLWKGCAVFLVGGGPSINDLPYGKLAERGVLSLAINNVAAKVPCKAMVINDPAEKFHIDLWRDGGLMKFIPHARLKRKSHTREKLPDGGFRNTGKNTPDYPNVWAFERRGWHTPESFLTDPAATYGNDFKGNQKTDRPRIIFTMFLALRLLHFLGVRRVHMIGVDFFMDPAKGLKGNYCFEDAEEDIPREEARQAEGVVNGNNDHYHVAGAMLAELRPIFEAADFHVFNVNPWSRLRAFDHVSWEDALADCRNGIAPGEPDVSGWYFKGEREAKVDAMK